MRIGIVGCGNVGLHHFVPSVLANEGMQLAAVAEPMPSRLDAAVSAGGLEISALHIDWRELIGRPDVDAVIMATPQQVRPDIAVAAAAAGKHLLCEKPLAAVPADAHRMVELSTFRSSWGRSATESESGVCLGSRVRENSAES